MDEEREYTKEEMDAMEEEETLEQRWAREEAEDKHAKEIGADYDLQGALEYNPQPYGILDIKKVLANVPGEHDGKNYHWILELNDGRFVYLEGGCDYTGWDCQSGAWSTFIDTPEEAVRLVEEKLAKEKEEYPWKFEPDNNYYPSDYSEVAENFKEQLANGRTETWRQQKDREFGL